LPPISQRAYLKLIGPQNSAEQFFCQMSSLPPANVGRDADEIRAIRSGIFHFIPRFSWILTYNPEFPHEYRLWPFTQRSQIPDVLGMSDVFLTTPFTVLPISTHLPSVPTLQTDRPGQRPLGRSDVANSTSAGLTNNNTWLLKGVEPSTHYLQGLSNAPEGGMPSHSLGNYFVIPLFVFLNFVQTHGPQKCL
jgi:hypothetical protein